MATVKYKPDQYHTVTPYLTVAEVSKVIDFLKLAFDAPVIERIDGPNGTIGHAEVRIGDSVKMMGHPREASQAMPATLYVYVPDVDATYKRALAAGAQSLQPPADAFYGDRTAGVADACGNHWYIATHKEDVSPEEIQRRAAAQMKK